MALITSKSRVKPKFSVGKRQEEAKKSRQDELDDLCVRGYACKLFRDDARAREIDRGSHLIPWMGDDTLKIDRYDGRGHLHDLRDFEQTGWNEDIQLSTEAARIEAICDEERYMALHTDLLEEQNRQEEELKRLNEAITSAEGYNAMAFGYGAGNEDYDPMQPTEDETESGVKKLVSRDYQPPPPPSYKEAEDSTAGAELEEPFIAPPELKLPPGMEQPMTLKMHVIIEKTAMFVINHGPQMEIIVKTKQANNPQFDFLQFDHFLNPYYKHILAAIKSKMYIPTVLRAPEPEKKKQGEIGSRRSSNSNSIQSDDDDEDLEGSGYLHPSLFAPPRPKPAAASMQHHPPLDVPHPDNIPPQLGVQHGELYHMMDPQQQQQQHQQQQLIAYYEGDPVTTSTPFHMPPMLAPPPPPLDHGNSGAPVQLSHPMGQLPPPGFLPGEPPLPGPVLPHHHPALAIHETGGHPHPPATMLGPPLISQDLSIPPASEESAIEPQPPLIVPPPPDIQPVIDKLAKYVAKNGDEFEASVRAKCDPRFEFLVPWHSYNAYYLAKKKMFIQEFNQGAESGSGEQKNASDKCKKVPVRFPIKPKKAEERTLERKSALPVESSSESDDNEEPNQTTSATNPLACKLSKAAPGAQYRDAMNYDDSEQQYSGMSQYGPQGGGMQFTGEGDGAYPYQEYDQDDADDRGMMEYGKEHQRTGGNHHGLEDRLAMAARKKLASASQERTLQVERRKKLALFLSHVKDRPQAAAAAQEGSTQEDPEREYREESDKHQFVSRRRSPVRSNRRERTASPPYTESRSSKKAPSVPKSYQTAVNREQMERERRRRHHSRSRSPSPRKMKRKSPPPLSAGTSAVIGRSSSTSSPTLESFQDREASVSSPGSDGSSKMAREVNTQPSVSDTKADAKGGASDLRAKIRAMLAATMNMGKEDIG